MAQILIQTKGFDLTEAMENQCLKGGKKLGKYDSKIEKLEFFLSGSSKRGFAAKLKVSRSGKDLFFEYRDPGDLYQAIREVSTKAIEEMSHLQDLDFCLYSPK